METLLERDRELLAVDTLLMPPRGVLIVEGGVGIGKTSLLQAACRRADDVGQEVLHARGSELERDFAWGIVRQLFERRLARAAASERDALLAGLAGAVRPLLLGETDEHAAFDTSFAVLHGLYWLTANLADRRPLLIAVDDAHWADDAFNAHDIDGFAAALADDVVFVAPGPTSGAGKAACAGFFAGWFRAFPDARVDVHEVHFIDDVAVEVGRFSGTHDGTLHSPAGDTPPTGRPVSLDYIQVLHFRDGKHASFNLMFDRLLMLEQLGLMPAPAPVRESAP